MADPASAPQDAPKADPATARAFSKLEAALKAGDCYGALQLYRTVVKRRIDAGAAGEAASLVARGAETLAAHGRPAEAGDLCEMLVKSYEATSTPLTRDSVDAVTGAARAFASRGALAAAAAVPFLRAACRWAARAPLRHGGRSAGGADDDDESDGDAASRHALCALLHAECARACVGAGPEFFADAQRHYLEADSAPEFGAFLWSWARGTAGGAAAGGAGGGAGGLEGAISGVRPLLPVSGGVGAGGGGGEGFGGYAHEADLFLARGVLQLLCCGDLGGANATRDAFLAAAKADASSTSSADGAGATSARALAAALDSPLSHFLRFLLLTLEREAGPLFLQLCEKYKPSLSRDPSFSAYTTSIGSRFFNIAPPSAMHNNKMMENLMGMLGGGGGGGGGGNPMAAMMQQMMAGMGGGGGLPALRR